MPEASKSPEVSVIIVNWNSKDYLRACLNSIKKHTRDIDYEVIVIDGASFDGCGEMLAAEFPEVKFLQSQVNCGFSKANNIAAKEASGTYLLLLNPDTELHENSILTLIEHLKENNGIGAIGCKLLNSDGSYQTTSSLKYPTLLNQLLDFQVLQDSFPNSGLWDLSPGFTPPGKLIQVESISGACVLTRTSLYEHLGGLSERYFMYSEDIDFGYRLNRNGTPSFITTSTAITHHGGGSSTKGPGKFSTVMLRESTYRFLAQYRGSLLASLYRTSIALLSISRIAMLSALSLLSRAFGRTTQGYQIQKWKFVFRWAVGLESWSKTI